MCRSCDQTPDGTGRRCPSRADGFTAYESEQRTRSRGLSSAQNALANGDPQEAANALARAVAAQRAMDGAHRNLPSAPPAPVAVAEPRRDIYVGPSSLPRLHAQLDNINSARARDGQPTVSHRLVIQRAPHPTDPMLRMERVRVELSGLSQDELNALSFEAPQSAEDVRVDTKSAISMAHAIARATGGYRSKADAGTQSTGAMLSAYLADEPGGRLRRQVVITPADEANAASTLAWARTNQPTSDYVRSVQQILTDETLAQRDLALAVSALPMAERQQKREQAQSAPRPAPASTSPATPAPVQPVQPVRRSVWIGEVGQYANTSGVVESVQVVEPYKNARNADLQTVVRIRTDGGASVKFWSQFGFGLEGGERVTITGHITKHEEYQGYKSTVFDLSEAPIRHRS